MAMPLAHGFQKPEPEPAFLFTVKPNLSKPILSHTQNPSKPTKKNNQFFHLSLKLVTHFHIFA